MKNKIQNDPNIFKEVKCGLCKKRISTKLCDFVIEYRQPAFFRNYEDFSEQELHGLCSLPMCDECATTYNRIYDFCPHHAALTEKIKPTPEMAKAISEYNTKELFKYMME